MIEVSVELQKQIELSVALNIVRSAGWSPLRIENVDGVLLLYLETDPEGTAIIPNIEVEDTIDIQATLPTPQRILVNGFIGSVSVNEITGEMTININNPWVPITLKSSDGVATAGIISEFPENAEFLISNQRVRQQDGSFIGGEYPFRRFIRLDNLDIDLVTFDATTLYIKATVPSFNEVIQGASWALISAALLPEQIVAAEEDLCDVCPTPSGICYDTIEPVTSFIDAGAGGLDTVALYQAGAYTITNPSYPTHQAKLDPSDTSRTTLVDNNFYGNKFRFTDTAGNRSSVGDSPSQRIDWKNHNWSGAIPYIVIDHRFKIMRWVQYLSNDGKYNLSTTSAGDSWYNWLIYISTVTLGGYSNWLPIPLDTRFPDSAHANAGESIYNNFFIAERPDNRCGFLTGESLNAAYFYPFRDSSNNNLITSGSGADSGAKLGDTSFASGIINVFPMRILTDADIAALLA